MRKNQYVILFVLMLFVCLNQTYLRAQIMKPIKQLTIHEENERGLPVIKVEDEDDRYKKIKNAIMSVIKNQNCLPKGHYDKIINHLKGRELFIDIGNPVKTDRECAATLLVHPEGKGKGKPFRGHTIVLNKEKIFKEERCGCLKSMMVHELLHWAGVYDNSDDGETRAYSCSLKCYGGPKGCAKIPPEYKNKAKPEKCCDKVN